ncbi:hypothetical protein HAX54_043004 [Datura stramonium]|uniref:Xyloglucan endotransglucosylase/hydrolase n=1 Tax=Datura stramonium TaxID=4076 RepID=A0ABS8W2Q5_DATST|nr:hypothetical protein [Datura stramonium]
MVSFQASLFIISFILVTCNNSADEVVFYQNYYQISGGDRLTVFDQGKEVQLSIDQYSGSGFMSNHDFGSGDFRIKLKLPNKNTSGVITTFYLMSQSPNESPSLPHDEVDFEFLGGEGKYTLNTNVFANDGGHREQRFDLWFDPTTDFHTYGVLWNQYHIVLSVDDVPIRVFKNNTNHGVNYPSKYMHVQATMWNDTQWVGEVDWSQGPFTAHYREFSINGCQYQDLSNLQDCNNDSYYWNTVNYMKLSPEQQELYEDVRGKHMTYNYCALNNKNFPECLLI